MTPDVILSRELDHQPASKPFVRMGRSPDAAWRSELFKRDQVLSGRKIMEEFDKRHLLRLTHLYTSNQLSAFSLARVFHPWILEIFDVFMKGKSLKLQSIRIK